MTRTHDLLITNQLLYRLSYTSLSLDSLFILTYVPRNVKFLFYISKLPFNDAVTEQQRDAKNNSLYSFVILSESVKAVKSSES